MIEKYRELFDLLKKLDYDEILALKHSIMAILGIRYRHLRKGKRKLSGLRVKYPYGNKDLFFSAHAELSDFNQDELTLIMGFLDVLIAQLEPTVSEKSSGYVTVKTVYKYLKDEFGQHILDEKGQKIVRASYRYAYLHFYASHDSNSRIKPIYLGKIFGHWLDSAGDDDIRDMRAKEILAAYHSGTLGELELKLSDLS